MLCCLRAPPPPLPRLWKNTEGPPLPCRGRGGRKAGQGALDGSPLSLPSVPAGVTGILATELFDQTARPAAYMVCGALMWAMLFLVGLAFPFLMVGLPLPGWGGGVGGGRGGGCLWFCPCQQENPSGRPPSKETEAEGSGAYPSKQRQAPLPDLLRGLLSWG